jgi:hypothetical protein
VPAGDERLLQNQSVTTGLRCVPAAFALLVLCRIPWAQPGTPCTDVGQHYARFLCFWRRCILDASGPAALSQATPNIAPQP